MRDLLSFFYVQDGTALVGAALGAGAMRQLLFVTVGALGEADRSQKVMGAAIGGAAPWSGAASDSA